MLENFQGDSWGSILPLRMSSLLPHDLCHVRSASRWPPTVSNHLILWDTLLFCFQSFPMHSLFAWGGQSIRASASSNSPSNEYSGLTSYTIDLFYFFAVQGTRVFSCTKILKHQIFGTLYVSTLISVHDYWVKSIKKKYSFDYTDCWQSNVSALICYLGLLYLSFQGRNVF